MTSRKFLPIIIPSGIFLLNLILKSLYAGSRDIAMDEPFSIFYAQQSAGEIISFFNSAQENNPPFYFLLLHYWMELFGDSPFCIRMLSVLCSAITAVVIFQTGNKYLNLFAGLVSSLIFTFSSLHIYYAHEARAYALFSLLAALSLFLYLGIMRNPQGRRNYFFLFLANLFLIYSHYFGFFILFLEAFCFFFLSDKRSVWKGLLIVFVSLGIFYLPHLFVMLDRFLFARGGTWVAMPAISEFYGNLNRFLNNKYCMIILITGFAMALGISAKRKVLGTQVRGLLADPVMRIIFLWFFVSYSAMFMLSFKMPMFIDRYILYTSVPFYLFIGGAFGAITLSGLTRTLTGLLLLCLILTVDLNPDNKRRIKEATDIVKELKTPQTLVMLAPEYADLGFTYHYNINYFKDYKNLRRSLEREKIFPVNSADMARTLLQSHTGNCVYFQADSQFLDPDNSILKTIAEKYSKHVERKVFEIYTIHYFSNRSPYAPCDGG